MVLPSYMGFGYCLRRRHSDIPKNGIPQNWVSLQILIQTPHSSICQSPNFFVHSQCPAESCFAHQNIQETNTMSLPAGTNLSQVPAMQPPAGVHSNLVDPPSYHDKLLILNLVFTLLMLVLVAVRLMVKGCISKVLWWDDREQF